MAGAGEAKISKSGYNDIGKQTIYCKLIELDTDKAHIYIRITSWVYHSSNVRRQRIISF